MYVISQNFGFAPFLFSVLVMGKNKVRKTRSEKQGQVKTRSGKKKVTKTRSSKYKVGKIRSGKNKVNNKVAKKG